jgi:transposase
MLDDPAITQTRSVARYVRRGLYPSPHAAPAVSGRFELLALQRTSSNRDVFCRLKNFRQIVTRYDNLAANFLSGVALADATAFWLCISPSPKFFSPKNSNYRLQIVQ